MKIELVSIEKRFNFDIKEIKQRYEDEILRLTAENDELKSVIEQPLYSKSTVASDKFSQSINQKMELHNITTEKEYFRNHYSTMKAKYDELIVKFVEEETKLRALILKNQEIIDHWTNRQYSTAE